MELFGQLDDGQTNRQTDGLTELFLKSLSRLKISIFLLMENGKGLNEIAIVNRIKLVLDMEEEEQRLLCNFGLAQSKLNCVLQFLMTHLRIIRIQSNLNYIKHQITIIMDLYF